MSTDQNATRIMGSDGSKVAIRNSSTLIIGLEGNPTTGYAWSVDKVDSAVLTLDGSSYEGNANTTQQVRVGGVFNFTFTAKAAGTAAVSFVYRRPWEQSVQSFQSCTVTVTVD
ncbi:protease inhibitor I42 family protein [Streptomyces sp. NPDC048650]|uniref:protease inhibitor I42 family protein n=1 Tax=Streptomyces sp. NPDC048650 TaxID=3365583 RepID=UPI0037143323